MYKLFCQELTACGNVRRLTSKKSRHPMAILLNLRGPLPQRPITLVIVLHGLEGNIDSFYARGMMQAVRNHGFDAVLMHFRNCSTHPNRMPRAYHSGETEDIGFLVNTLQARFPNRELYAVGFSLGGNVLAKYLGEQGSDCALKGASVVSAPFDLSTSCQVIRRSCFKLYQKYLLDKLKKSTARKLPQIQAQLQLNENALMAIDDLWLFDEAVTAPLHGFAGAEDYYEKASGQPYLQHIAIPTLVIHAEDDPMLSTEAVPKAESSQQKRHVSRFKARRPCWIFKRKKPVQANILVGTGCSTFLFSVTAR